MNAKERKKLKASNKKYYIFRDKDGYYFRAEGQGITKLKKEAFAFSFSDAKRLVKKESFPGWRMIEAK